MAFKVIAFRLGMLFALLALPVKLVALVIPWWAYTEAHYFGDTWKSNLGLWKWCTEVVDFEGASSTTCRGFTSTEEFIVTSRNLIVFGLLLFFLGLVIVSAQNWFVQDLIFLAFLGPLVMCIAGSFTWIATVTYAEDYVKTPGHYPSDIHAGWMMAGGSSLLCYVSGILFAARKLCRK